MRLIAWTLALPLLVLAMVFAVANRHSVRLDLWPLPWGIDLPAYLAVLGALVLGMAIGICVTWVSGHRTRLTARQNRHRVESLTRQLDAERGKAALPAPPARDNAA